MPDLQDLTDGLIENMAARREAVSRAIEALEAITNGGAPKKPAPRLKAKKAAPAAPRKAAAKAAKPSATKPNARLPRDAFLSAVTRVLGQSGKPMRVVAIRDALLQGEFKGRNPKALYNQICNNLAGKKAFKRGPAGVSLA